MKLWVLWISLLAILLVSCGGQREPLPTSLPTAIPPPEQETGDFAVSFSYEFPEEAWTVGTHRYQYLIHCPDIYQEDVSTEWTFFEVIEGGKAFSMPVYLRLAGLSTDVLDAINLEAIYPRQETVAVVTLVGVAEAWAESAGENCEVLVRWDYQLPQGLTAGEPFRP